MPPPRVNYDPFEGDGRTRVQPLYCRWGLGVAVTRAQGRMLIDHFIASGKSIHSRQGSTIWVVVWWALLQRRDYSVTEQFIAGEIAGYVVQLHDISRKSNSGA